MADDFPAFERPAKAISRMESAGRLFRSATVVRKRRNGIATWRARRGDWASKFSGLLEARKLIKTFLKNNKDVKNYDQIMQVSNEIKNIINTSVVVQDQLNR